MDMIQRLLNLFSQKSFLCLLLAVFCAIPVAKAQDKLFIQNPKTVGMDAELANSFVAFIAEAAMSFRQFDISTFSDLQAVLDLDQQRDLLDCNDTSCMVEIRNAIGARYSVSTTITKFEGSFMLSLAFIDTESYKVLARVSASKVNDVTTVLGKKTVDLLNEAVTVLYPGPNGTNESTAEDKEVPDKRTGNNQKPTTATAKVKAVKEPRKERERQPADPKLKLKIWTITTGTIGGVTLLTGSSLAIGASFVQKRITFIESKSSYDPDYLHKSTRRKKGIIAAYIPCFAVGTAAAATTISLGVLYAKRNKTPAISITPVFDQNGAYLSLGGSW